MGQRMIYTALRSPWTTFLEWRYTRPSDIWCNWEIPVRHEPQKNERKTHNYLQSVTVRVGLNIVTSIPMLHVWHNNKGSAVELICPKEFYMSRSTWAISYSQTIGNIYVGCGYASTLTMSTRPAVNVVVKFGKIISYFDFLTDCLHAATSIPHHQNESHSNGPSSWVWDRCPYPKPSARLECYSKFLWIPDCCWEFGIHINEDNTMPIWRTRNAQTTWAYLWPKLHFIRCDHPTLQFNPNSTGCSEVSQNVREELQFAITIQTKVKSSLERHYHCHDTAILGICAVRVQSTLTDTGL